MMNRSIRLAAAWVFLSAQLCSALNPGHFSNEILLQHLLRTDMRKNDVGFLIVITRAIDSQVVNNWEISLQRIEKVAVPDKYFHVVQINATYSGPAIHFLCCFN